MRIFKTSLKSLGGEWKTDLDNGPGFVFPLEKKAEVTEVVRRITSVDDRAVLQQDLAQKTTHLDSSPNDSDSDSDYNLESDSDSEYDEITARGYITADEELVYDKAYREGYSSGYQKGYSLGYQEGYSLGYQEGSREYPEDDRVRKSYPQEKHPKKLLSQRFRKFKWVMFKMLIFLILVLTHMSIYKSTQSNRLQPS